MKPHYTATQLVLFPRYLSRGSATVHDGMLKIGVRSVSQKVSEDFEITLL